MSKHKNRSYAYQKARLMVLQRDGYICQYCGRPVKDYKDVGAVQPKDKATVDHIRPRSRGGPNEPENMVTACDECNSCLGSRFKTFEKRKHYIESLRSKAV